MLITAWFLAVLAIILAWPAPVLLARSSWPSRSPFAALVLWQAIGLAGGLSMIGAMLCYGLSPLGDNLVAGLHALILVMLGSQSTEGLGFWHAFALSTAGVLTVHLLFTLLLTYVRISTERRRHRELLGILSQPHGDSGTVVIAHAAPVAYCLPGGARSITVLSDSLMEALDERELAAVLAHEDSHLTQRHHLLLWAFAAWRAALPWLPTTRVAQRAVNELLEMLADDAALKVSDAGTLVRAVAVVADGQQPRRTALDADTALAGDDAAVSATTVARVKRLLAGVPTLPAAQRAVVLASSVLLLLAPTALLIVPGVVHL